MKAHMVILMLALILGSCSSDDDGQNSVEVSGRLISQVTGKGIADGVIYIKVEEYKGSGIFGYSEEISSREVQTDNDGFFTSNLRFNNKENVILFQQINEELATGILNDRKSFKISELEPLLFEARVYQELQIKVKNTAPFDVNDAIRVSIFQPNTTYSNSIIYQIENFGDQNEPYGPPADDNGLNPYWIGDNVNSVIYGHIQEGASFLVKWSVRKNGITDEYQSEYFDTVSGEVNFYELNY